MEWCRHSSRIEAKFSRQRVGCPDCTGLGSRTEVDPSLVVPDDTRSLADGAIAPWTNTSGADYYTRLLEALAAEAGFSTTAPWRELPAEAQQMVLYGTEHRLGGDQTMTMAVTSLDQHLTTDVNLVRRVPDVLNAARGYWRPGSLEAGRYLHPAELADARTDSRQALAHAAPRLSELTT
ncbi:hypothetical protein ACIQWB_38045 [Streptomyces olivaceus]|uniref:hypothetical protein n=1 Tax=Streptomyces olivaceus TaxID=47716 RepID=UPI00382FAF57